MSPRSVRRTLPDGDQVLIRPIRPGDKGGLRDGVERLRAESRYRRFLSATPRLSDAALRYLTEVDHHDHEALLAVDPRTRDGLGVARYVRSAEDRSMAEAAVAVIDDWQRRGLGTMLLGELAARARAEGIERFSASVLAENYAVIEFLHKLGDVHVTGRAGGVVELVLELPGEGIPETLRHTFRAAARGELALERRDRAGRKER
jgi:GNAT superfamily N-acetyltransferase